MCVMKGVGGGGGGIYRNYAPMCVVTSNTMASQEGLIGLDHYPNMTPDPTFYFLYFPLSYPSGKGNL